jgi:hypothetical protein
MSRRNVGTANFVALPNRESESHRQYINSPSFFTSVRSTEASASLPARVGVVGPKHATERGYGNDSRQDGPFAESLQGDWFVIFAIGPSSVIQG